MKRTVRNNSDANWKWSCESEANFTAFVDEVRKLARRAGKAEGLREAALIAECNGEFFDQMEPYYEAPKHQLCMDIASDIRARAEEVERG